MTNMEQKISQPDGILFANLAAAVSVSSREYVSEQRRAEAWQAVRYETAAVQGTMLLATQEMAPPPVTIPLNLTGWHRIYVCLADIGGLMYTYLKLSGDRCRYGVKCASMSACPTPPSWSWSPTEHVEEALWRCADLTGRELTISRPVGYIPSSSAVVWIRCVPMTDAEVSAYEADESRADTRSLHAHFDTDFIGNDQFAGIDDYMVKLEALRGSDVKICSQEVALDHAGYFDAEHLQFVGTTVNDQARVAAGWAFHPIRGEVYRTLVARAHDLGIQLHAAQRMNIASFDFPFAYPHFRVRFSDEHPEYAIVTRDGRRMAAPSYAYPEVQDYVIRTLLDVYQYGFDGVTLIWTRGIHLGFEEPVAERVREGHPGIDPATLPAADARLHDVWCDILTGFMRKLRAALDGAAMAAGRARPGIMADVFADIRLGRQAGLDVERWAREGLVTGVIQDNMIHYEDLAGCMTEGDPARIDMQRYREQLGRRKILHRHHGNQVAQDPSQIRPYAALRQYGVEVFHAMPWEHSVPPEEFLRLARELYANGACALHLWDCNSRVRYLPEWNVQRKLGHREELAGFPAENRAYRTIHRVLRWNDLDISYANPNWRG